MNRVIKDFAKFDDSTQEDIYASYSEGELERTSFPFKGEISEGVIYKTEETHYLIPRSSIIAGKAGSSEDLDDDDDEGRIALQDAHQESRGAKSRLSE